MLKDYHIIQLIIAISILCIFLIAPKIALGIMALLAVLGVRLLARIIVNWNKSK